ncbi:MAG TPA: hypothetical protein VFM63_08195 [Pyrinomonadaceae bacterium]|nr:hypothetical protein [Pyrinomonadaceae bacterium]
MTIHWSGLNEVSTLTQTTAWRGLLPKDEHVDRLDNGFVGLAGSVGTDGFIDGV